MKNGTIRRTCNSHLWAAVLAVVLPGASSALAGTTGSEVTVSISGSTAVKNWLVKTNTFTDVQPGSELTIGGMTYPPPNPGNTTPGDNNSDWVVDGGSAYAYQLAPATYGSPDTNLGDPVQSADAVRFEYHESGSVEGILEMASDQIGTAAAQQYVTNNVDRNPTLNAYAGNNVWVNYNQFGSGKGGWTSDTAGSTHGGQHDGWPISGRLLCQQRPVRGSERC
jgi:hypothetical protein